MSFWWCVTSSPLPSSRLILGEAGLGSLLFTDETSVRHDTLDSKKRQSFWDSEYEMHSIEGALNVRPHADPARVVKIECLG
jgi:hypothetical protein